MASGSDLKVLSWNLFHGRDAPADESLCTWRSRLLRTTEDNGVYIQVNRSLEREFATLIAGADWSVCLLQEVPPTWTESLAGRSQAQFTRCLTSRNQLRALTALLARFNPDLIRSWEGGSNLTLVRPPWRIVEGTRRSLILSPVHERGLRERRRMCFVRIRAQSGSDAAADVCVANLHVDSGKRNERELRRAAEAAAVWSGGAPLVLGGDFNLRPRTTGLFDELEHRFGLREPTADDAIDHLLARGLGTIQPPERWPPRSRELELPHMGGSRRLRLSDHAPVEAVFAVRGDAMRY